MCFGGRVEKSARVGVAETERNFCFSFPVTLPWRTEEEVHQTENKNKVVVTVMVRAAVIVEAMIQKKEKMKKEARAGMVRVETNAPEEEEGKKGESKEIECM